MSRIASATRIPNDAASAIRRPCWIRSSSGPMNGAMIANGAMFTSRYSATFDFDSACAAAKNSVFASATIRAASTALLRITG
ncbi:hypothetical protein MTP03_07770 [Tsukamurella sp. PLM1]|nr:hypothetical protein MTP03_07770 [Tsukamurella sp. PLM1]